LKTADAVPVLGTILQLQRGEAGNLEWRRRKKKWSGMKAVAKKEERESKQPKEEGNVGRRRTPD
jgi:hypothetical protein